MTVTRASSLSTSQRHNAVTADLYRRVFDIPSQAGTITMKEQMFASIDLGSNSFRLHIGAHDGDSIRIVKSVRDPIRLAAGLDGKGFLTEQAMQIALGSLARLREILNAYSLDAVRVVATNTLRIAQNATTFLPVAEKAIGYPIEIISGEEEGRLKETLW
jgi:exopolyphosphatase/guanosine-5'-triphosphate,3'-diphosphate pyrophosphatase